MNQKSVIDAYWESKSYYTKDYNMWNYTDVPFSLKVTFLHSYDINVLKNVNLVARDWWRSSQNLSIFSYIKSRFQMNVKKIHDCLSFAQLRSMIGLEKTRATFPFTHIKN